MTAATSTTAPPEPGRQALATQDSAVLAWRFRLFASCLALVALAFVQKPGKVVADTKLDLAVDPEGLLRRAVYMWDPEGAFGQLQNQGYGYLFPMGPFFWMGSLVDMPAWAVQRAWYAVVLVVAFLGVVKLAGALGVGTPLTRIIAGFAFALSPRLVTTLGPISVEAWPSAIAPWVLVPLVCGTRRGSPMRAAALSALAIACVGGVNAAAAAAVLPLPALWLLLQRAGPRRRQLMLWWPVFTLLGTLWWLVPLFLLGRYSPPFLDFIESAAATTFPTTIFDVLRGTSHWVPYVEADWQAGRILLTEPYLIIDTAVVVALGLVGLAWRGMPHRGFLVTGFFIGLVIVTAGHLGALQGWWAEDVHGWLDGGLAPLRNLHKFDVILRIPLVLGLAHVVAVAQLRLRRLGDDAGPQRVFHAGMVAIAMVAVLGSATPMLAGKFTRVGEFASIPGYWGEAAQWLAERDSGTYALLVPGSSFGSYVWGHPADEPIQPLAGAPWAVRNAIPLAPAGNIRMLDAVESRLNSGEGSPGLARFLARAGVEYLVVRNDLVRSNDVPEPVLVHQALADSPGIVLEAVFGPALGGEARLDEGRGPRVVVNHGWQSVYPAIEIYRVSGAVRAVASTPPPVVAGGPEDLLRLTDLGVIGDEPTVLAVDADQSERSERVVLTDGLRLRSAAFGRIHDNDSPTLTRAEAAQERRASREYVLGPDDRWATVARFEGLREIRASSSRSDLGVLGGQPQHSPFAAVDGDLMTSWISGYRDGPDGPWLELHFERPVVPGRVGITLGDAAGRDVRRVQVTTDHAQVVSGPLQVEQRGRVALGSRKTRSLRIELAEQSRSYGARLDIAEIEIPGVEVSRPLVLPTLPHSWGTPDTVVLSASDGYTDGCVQVQGEVRCAPGRGGEGEDGALLDRVLRLNGDRSYSTTVLAAPRPGPELDQLIQQGLLVQASASTSTTSDPRGGALAAVDGSPGTTWVADPEDVEPALAVQWIGRRVVDEIALDLHESAAAVPAVSVELESPFGRRTVQLDRDGRGSFRPLRTDQLTVRFLTWGRGSNLNFDETATDLTVGVSELTFPGVDVVPIRLDATPRRWGCGSGPSITVNGAAQRSALVASTAQLYKGETVEADLCISSTTPLNRGENRLVVGSSPGIRPEAVILDDGAGSSTALVRTLPLRVLDPSRAELPTPLDASTSSVVVRQNQNSGWQASVDGDRLAPMVVDGWQQAWELGQTREGTIDLRFAPSAVYRAALLVGLLTGLALIVIAATVRSGASLPATGQSRLPLWLGVGLAVMAMGLVAGTWGAVAVVGALLLAWLGPARTWQSWISLLLVAPFAAAAALYVLNPWGDPQGWAGSDAAPQLLVVLTLALLLGVALRDRGPLPKRMKGRSTPQ